MNPDTRIAICCYAGDAFQVTEMLDLYRHHECPITVLSPDDSRANVPGVENLFGGKNIYLGWAGVERFKLHLHMLLAYPEKHFLIHDSDSVVLEPQLPGYLYAEPDIVWSNKIDNGVPEQQPGFPPGVPHVAFQPPWFLSRATIERLLEVGDRVKPNEFIPFIDYWMVEATTIAGLRWRGFEGRMSVPMALPEYAQWACDRVRNDGYTFIHSAKGARHAAPLIAARQDYLRTRGLRA